MNRAPKSTAAFDDLITALQEIRDGYVLSDQRFTDPIDVVEGYRSVGQLLSAASELFFEADPDHPRLASIVSPARKLQGDNPDAIYHYARISGTGPTGCSARWSASATRPSRSTGRAPDGAMAGPILGDINDRQLEVAPDGSYSLVLSAHGASGELAAPPSGRPLPRGAQLLPAGDIGAERSRAFTYGSAIEHVGPYRSATPAADDVFAQRMSEGVAFLRQTTLGQTLPDVQFTGPVRLQRAQRAPDPVQLPGLGSAGARRCGHLLRHRPAGGSSPTRRW